MVLKNTYKIINYWNQHIATVIGNANIINIALDIVL